MTSSKEVIYKRYHLKGVQRKGSTPKDDYCINSSRNRRPRGGSDGIKTIFETTSFMDGPLCIARRKAVAARLHERRRLRNLRFLGCGSGGLLGKYGIAYYKLRAVCMYYVCMCLVQYRAEELVGLHESKSE